MLQDKVVIQRLDQLCECVLKGEWPIVSKVADALLQNQLAANSPMPAGYPGLADVDMASLPPGFAVGEDGLPEDPSKAFKLKRVSLELALRAFLYHLDVVVTVVTYLCD